ncbi:MAG: hypothetical protein WDA00_07085 [Eubacteriales bacterium]
MKFLWAFLLGVLYVPLCYGGATGLFYLLVSRWGMGGRAIWELAAAQVLIVAGFVWLSATLTKRRRAHRLAFPLGVFLAADTALIAILFALMQTEQLVRFAGSVEGARVYAMGLMALIPGLVGLVIVWLASVLVGLMRRLQQPNYPQSK